MLINNNNTVSNKRANKKFNIDKPVFGERNKIKFVKEIIKKTSTKKKKYIQNIPWPKLAPDRPYSEPKSNAYGIFPSLKTVQYEDIEFPLDHVRRLLLQQRLMSRLPEIDKKR